MRGELTAQHTPAQLWTLAPLIAGQPIYRAGRWHRGHFGYPGVRAPLGITSDLPTAPAAVLVHDVDQNVRTLCLDLDTSKAHQSVVDNDATRLGQLLASAGLAFVEDISPSGGRHLYVPLQEPIPAIEARDLVEALALRASSLDPGPHQNFTTGCIRVPGSAHKRGGHQVLITPFAQAHDILSRRNPGEALSALRREMAPEEHRVRLMRQKLKTKQKRQVRPLTVDTVRSNPATTTRAASGRNESQLRTLARTGMYSTTRYESPSEARMAVLNHFAASCWTLDQVKDGMAGPFTGLAALYGAKADRLLAEEWNKAQTFTGKTDASRKAGGKNAHNYDTSRTELTRGGRENSSDLSIQQLVNDLENILYAVLDHRLKDCGRVGVSLRFLFRAVLAYMRTNKTDLLDVGCRTFAVALGKDVATIARLLPLLEKSSAGILTRIERGRGRKADTYRVQLPPEFEQLARELNWRRGKIHAIRPVFRVLGDVAGLAYEGIERSRYSPTTADLTRTTGISRRALIDHLSRMESLQMIRRHNGHWEIAPHTDLLALADRMGATEDRQAQITRYRKQRAQWHAWLDRHNLPELVEYELHDAEIEEYWLPPTDDPHQLQLQLWHAA